MTSRSIDSNLAQHRKAIGSFNAKQNAKQDKRTTTARPQTPEARAIAELQQDLAVPRLAYQRVAASGRRGAPTLGAAVVMATVGMAMARGGLNPLAAPELAPWNGLDGMPPQLPPLGLAPSSELGAAPGPALSKPVPLPPAVSIQLNGTAYDFPPLLQLLKQTSKQPLLAQDSDDNTFFVRSYHTDARQGWVDTSNVYDPDTTTGSSLSFFAGQASVVCTQEGARGLPLTAQSTAVDTQGARIKPLETYTFQQFANNDTGGLMAFMRGPHGHSVTLTMDDFNNAFPDGTQKVVNAASGQTPRTPDSDAQPEVFSFAPAPPAPLQPGVGVSTLSRADLNRWLTNTTTPAIAYGNDGTPYLMHVSEKRVPAPAAGYAPTPGPHFEEQVRHVTLTDARNPATQVQMSLREASDELRYIDTARSGVGTQLESKAGTKYTYKGLTTVAGTPHVALERSGDIGVFTLSQFQQEFGSEGVTALFANAASEPNFLGVASGFVPPPSNAVLFSKTPGAIGPQLVMQGQVGDCYFDAVIAAILAQDPEYAESIVRPSHDRVANNFDIRLYDPTLNVTAPHYFTATHLLPPLGEGGGDRCAVDGLGIPQFGVPMIEKGYVLANQQYGWHTLPYPGTDETDPAGYDSISGGFPEYAMQMLTGLPAEGISTDALSHHELWHELSRVNDGHLVTLCTGDAQVPGGYTLPGVEEGHAYTVLATAEDANGRRVKLRNPWGFTEPDGQGGVNKGGDGEFWMPLAQVPQAFDWLSLGRTPSKD